MIVKYLIVGLVILGYIIVLGIVLASIEKRITQIEQEQEAQRKAFENDINRNSRTTPKTRK